LCLVDLAKSIVAKSREKINGLEVFLVERRDEVHDI
jgi:hypothetical protein